ncbi:hypothetical protein MUO66_09805, partial [Candidatus Bathyarchaeota archaeon]|nr:hypothetical protein [Candidatus Bathyarchaeota archaeon]
DNADDAATLKERLEKSENEKVALEMKLSESDKNLYNEDYINYLNDKKSKQRSEGAAFGGRIADYTDEQLAEMGNNIPQLIKVITGEVYDRVRTEDDKRQTTSEVKAQKKRVAEARIEITGFAAIRPDFKELAPTIKNLSDEHGTLSLKQLYSLAGGKYPDGKKGDPTKDIKGNPNTRPKGEVGMTGSDQDKTMRDVISEEWDKIK